jgi:hypothetical protein
LRSWLSEAIWNRIVDIWIANNKWHYESEFNIEDFDKEFSTEWFENLRKIGLSALTGHHIKMNHPDFTELHKPQENGQLMGSIISFPILCIANAVLCRMAINVDRLRDGLSPLGVRQLSLKINGDDCLLPLSEFGYQAWLAITKEGGLESSVGKTYFSRDFVTLNSTLYIRDKDTFLRTKGVNFGIMFGQSRSSNKNNEVNKTGKTKISKSSINYGQYGTLLRQLKKDSPDYLWLAIKSMFIKHHFKELSQCKMPWFLPEWAGGLGFPIDSEKEISEADLHVASLIKLHRIHVPQLSKLKEWRMHELAQARLQIKPIPYQYMMEGSDLIDIQEAYDEAYGWIVFDEFHRATFHELYNMTNDDEDAKQDAYHKILKIRKKVEKLIYKEQYELIEISELLNEKKDFYPPIKMKSLDYSHMGIPNTD